MENENTGTEGATAVAVPVEDQGTAEAAKAEADHTETQAAIADQSTNADTEDTVLEIEANIRSAFRWLKAQLTGMLGFDHDCDHLKAAEDNAVANIQPKQ